MHEPKIPKRILWKTCHGLYSQRSKMNPSKYFALSPKQKAIDTEAATISFVALSKEPILRKDFLSGAPYYVSIDTKNITFNAKRFYLDHDTSFENAIGTIKESKLDEGGNIKVVVQFFPELSKSHEAFLKYKNNLSDSVSVGFGDWKIEKRDAIEGIAHFHITSGEIIELSAVWEGADKRAKITEFQKTKGVNMNETLQIIELAKIAGKEAQGLEAIKNNTSLKDFSKSLIEESKLTQAPPTPAKKKELCFSLANYAKSVFAGQSVGEIEFSQGSNGYIIPNSFYTRFESTQATTTTQNQRQRGRWGVRGINAQDILKTAGNTSLKTKTQKTLPRLRIPS